MNVRYCGPYMDASGYGEATRNYIRALVEAEVPVTTERVTYTKNTYSDSNAHLADSISSKDKKYKIKIIHTTPDDYERHMEKGKYHIGHLFWETDKLPSSWVIPCNKMDEIWTGTRLGADVIKSSGVTTPVYIFPQAVENRIPPVRPWLLPNFNGKIFYSIIEWTERKNPRLLFDAFWKEFKGVEDVALVVKTFIGDHDIDGRAKLIAEAKGWKNTLGFKDVPRAFITSKVMTKEEMYMLHEMGDCYVSAHRGEGWGLPQAEAAVFGKPLISTAFGGIHEYLTKRHYFPIDFDLIEIKETHSKYYQKGQKWADPKEASLRLQMRTVYDFWAGVGGRSHVPQLRGGSLRKLVTVSFSYDVVGLQLASRLKEIEKKLKK